MRKTEPENEIEKETLRPLGWMIFEISFELPAAEGFLVQCQPLSMRVDSGIWTKPVWHNRGEAFSKFSTSSSYT